MSERTIENKRYQTKDTQSSNSIKNNSVNVQKIGQISTKVPLPEYKTFKPISNLNSVNISLSNAHSRLIQTKNLANNQQKLINTNQETKKDQKQQQQQPKYDISKDDPDYPWHLVKDYVLKNYQFLLPLENGDTEKIQNESVDQGQYNSNVIKTTYRVHPYVKYIEKHSMNISTNQILFPTPHVYNSISSQYKNQQDIEYVIATQFKHNILPRLNINNPHIMFTLQSQLNFQTNQISFFYESQFQTLDDILIKRRESKLYMPENEIMGMAKGLFYAFKTLQSLNSHHGHIDSDTVYYDEDYFVFRIYDNELINGKYQGLYRLLNFISLNLSNLDKQIDIERDFKFKPGYLAPECLQFAKQVIQEQKQGFIQQKVFLNQFKTDVFSYGMILLESATLIKSYTYYDFQKIELDQDSIQSSIDFVKKHYSNTVSNLIQSCLQQDINKRPDWNQVAYLLKDQNTIEFDSMQFQLPKINFQIKYNTETIQKNQKQEQEQVKQIQQYTSSNNIHDSNNLQNHKIQKQQSLQETQSNNKDNNIHLENNQNRKAVPPVQTKQIYLYQEQQQQNLQQIQTPTSNSSNNSRNHQYFKDKENIYETKGQSTHRSESVQKDDKYKSKFQSAQKPQSINDNHYYQINDTNKKMMFYKAQIEKKNISLTNQKIKPSLQPNLSNNSLQCNSLQDLNFQEQIQEEKPVQNNKHHFTKVQQIENIQIKQPQSSIQSPLHKIVQDRKNSDTFSTRVKSITQKNISSQVKTLQIQTNETQMLPQHYYPQTPEVASIKIPRSLKVQSNNISLKKQHQKSIFPLEQR